MTYLGQETDFVKSSYSLILFEAYFRNLLGALPPWNTLFEFLCGIFTSQNVINLHAVIYEGNL